MKEKVAAAIVRFRTPLLLLFFVLAVFSAGTISRVQVNYDLTSYLREDTDTMRGLRLMEGEFSSVASLSVVLIDADEAQASAYAGQFSELADVLRAAHDPQSGLRERDGHSYRLISVICAEAAGERVLSEIESALSGQAYLLSGGPKDNIDLRENIAREIPLVMAVSCAIVLAVLLLMTRSYIEPVLFFLVIAVSIALNMGTNWIFSSISFITFAVAAILQLALAMDYSIMLMNAFDRLRRTALTVRDAMRQALSEAFMPVFSSALTTVAGMLALVFMRFTIGFDIGMVLAKGIVLSMLTVFLFMPGLLTLCAPLLDKTAHRPVPLPGKWLSALSQKLHGALPLLLIALIFVSALLQGSNVYTYTVRDMGRDAQAVSDLFGQNNQLVLLFPRDTSDEGYAAQREMLSQMDALTFEGQKAVKETLSMVTTGAAAIETYDAASAAALLGRSESSVSSLFTLLGIREPLRGDELLARLSEAAQRFGALLPADALSQLEEAQTLMRTTDETFNGENYSRAILTLALPLNSPQAHDAVAQIKEILRDTYGEDCAMVGLLVAMDDIATSFNGDMARVSLITIALVFLIVLCSFRTMSVPLLLVCVIEGAICINMTLSMRLDGSIFFMCYLICMALQMGATIDYGILLTSHYRSLRALLPPQEAAAEALNRSLQTICTSGLALITAGFAVGAISSVFYISSIGSMLGRGATVSVVLILFLLPRALIVLDRFIVPKKFLEKQKKRELSAPSDV